MKTWIYRAIIILLFFGICKTCITSHIDGSNETMIKNLETMIADDSYALVQLSNEYKETTIKVMRLPVKTYEFDYTFSLNEKMIEGKIKLNKLPESRNIKLFYLIDDPNIISQNLQLDLENEKEKDHTYANLIGGIIFGFLGLLVLISTVKKFKKVFQPAPLRKRKVKNPPIVSEDEIKKTETQKNKNNNQEIKTDKEDHDRFMPK